jgi:hypothetical protein
MVKRHLFRAAFVNPTMKRIAPACCAFLFAGFVPASGAGELAKIFAGGGSNVVAVYSDVARDYVRARLPDGSLQPETYAFGEGGFIPGFMPDATIDRLDFKAVAHAIAASRAGRKYLPSEDPAATRLLVMVYWGTTSGFRDMFPISVSLFQYDAFSLMQWRMRNTIDFHNAGILGYNADGLVGTDEGNWLQTTALRHKVDDLFEDVERSRYFVVLMAYDFQMMWKQKQPKLLWVTRLSIGQRRNDFGQELPTMLRDASKYFGRRSHGLIRDVVPEGRVDVGEPKSLGAEPEK